MKDEPMRKITVDQFYAELKAQGVPRNHLAFICPACSTIQSMQDLLDSGKVSTEKVENYIGFSCVGRFTHQKPPPKKNGTQIGCNWTLGGLFSIHKLEIDTGDGKTNMLFEVATPKQAQEHMKAHGVKPEEPVLA